jgi:hypothetical protein
MMMLSAVGSLPAGISGGSIRGQTSGKSVGSVEESFLEQSRWRWREAHHEIESVFRTAAAVNPDLARRLASGSDIQVPFFEGDETVFELDGRSVASLHRYSGSTDLLGYFVYLSKAGDLLTFVRVYRGWVTEEIAIPIGGSGETVLQLGWLPSREDQIQWIAENDHLLVILRTGPRQERKAGRLIVKTVTAL